MTYEQSLDFIHGIERFGTKPGLRRVRMLLERMGNPQDKLKFIHVAGTDGKGSTCTMLSHIFAAAGYRTGLYISPYVVDFRERIQLDNRMIPREELAASTEAVKLHWDALHAVGETPTEFEVVVAVAMDYFARMKCQLVVLEVGMGGRYDATNVIPAPLCSVITHISMDHMQYLGDSLRQIALEKCGIIKKGGVTVSYPAQDPEALAVILERCAEEGNELHLGSARVEVLEENLSGSVFRHGQETYRVSMGGRHQVLNAVTALEAVAVAASRGFPVGAEHISQGLAAARLPSRTEILRRSPLVLLDGGHNPAEAEALSQTLDLLRGQAIHAVVGMLADKNADACLAHILPHCASVTAVTPDYPRALPAGELAKSARNHCKAVSVAENTRSGLAEAFRHCGAEDVLLCFGSLYLAGEIRPILLEWIKNGVEASS